MYVVVVFSRDGSAQARLIRRESGRLRKMTWTSCKAFAHVCIPCEGRTIVDAACSVQLFFSARRAPAVYEGLLLSKTSHLFAR